MKSKLNVLVVYSNHAYPIRATIEDHLYSFRRYSSHRCYYLNLGLRRVPQYILRTNFDLIIFHTIFLSYRWSPELFAQLREKATPLKQINAIKVALPQDEFIHTDVLCDFINEFGVDFVFSVAPESEWEKIYSGVDRQKVTFHTVLTGYLDDETIERINNLARAAISRTIDVGYRAWHAAPWLGRHGLLKVKILDLFREKAADYGLHIDVSTNEKDTLLGDDWFKFLLQCKYTVGVEGGASILDKDGSIKRRTEEFLARNPRASFEEIEAACFPNIDGSLDLMALSPRHLEACATRTCQVLVAGEYNGVLVAGEHYIELQRDFSNAKAVFETIKQNQARRAIVERAYRDIVESGRYSYRNFVAFVIDESAKGREPQPAKVAMALRETLVFYRTSLVESGSWFYLRWINPLRLKLRLLSRVYGVLSRVLPDSVFSYLRRLKRAKNS